MSSTTENLLQKRLKELLHYNPDTGIFKWKDTSGKRNGEKAGCLNADGYLIIAVDGRTYRANRLVFLYMEGEFPVNFSDHRNRVRDDNRWENLRHATRRENNHNSISNNKVIGVTWKKRDNKWEAYGNRIAGHLPYLGMYVEYWDAVCARKKWENLHY